MTQGSCFVGELSPLIVSSVIDGMALGLMVVNPQGHIVVANRALAQILGHPREEMLQKGWAQLFIDNERNLEFNQVFIDVIWKEMVNLQRAVPYLRPDGEARTLSVTSSYLSADGAMQGIVLLVEDVTERESLIARERRLAGTMHQMQAERTEGLNKLALSVAHQIRNPMMTIGGFAGLLRRRQPGPEESGQYLDIIRDELRKLEGLVAAVVEFAGIGTAEKAPVELLHLAERAVHRLGARLAERQPLDVPAPRIQLDCVGCTLLGDEDLLSRALVELLCNAVEATAGQGGDAGGDSVITLQVRHVEQQVQVLVTDHGEGIHQEYLPYIFDPFFTTRTDRVGMGLCLVKRIVLEHMGSIQVQSEPGAGTSMTLLLPRE